MSTPSPAFANWAANQTCSPAVRVSPASEAEVQQAVRSAAAAGQTVRVVGTGHSFSPVHLTNGALIALDRLRGLVGVDPARRRATALPGTAVGDFGDALWDSGLGLPNQGDIDTQTISGAIATATHGSGPELQCFSAALRRCRLVTGSGEVLEIGEDDPARLRAAQVAIGMLGVMTEIEIEVVSAYRLRERIEQWPWQDVVDRWDEMLRGHRHFSFFWLPSEGSAALYGLTTPPGETSADTCYVKIYDEVGAAVPDDSTPGRRVDRSYRIYPQEFEPNFHELEYFVPLDRARDVMTAMRRLMLRRLPDSIFPMEIRTVAADDAYLSPNYKTPTLVISVSGVPGTDYWPYLRAVDGLLGDFRARVHWGKLHFLTRAQLLERYAGAGTFIDTRRELDPAGTFLNEHLRELFA